MKRRNLLIGLGLTPVTASVLMRTASAAQAVEKKPESETEDIELLFVQNAHSVELKDNVLRLNGVNPTNIFFSDRPERIVGHEPTEDFVAEWGEGENSFADNHPNAALSILIGEKPQEVILELMNPRLANNNLTYDVKVLDGNKTVTGAAVSLFIDPLGRPMSPTSVAGVHRRHRRRRRRAIRRPGGVGPGPAPSG